MLSEYLALNVFPHEMQIHLSSSPDNEAKTTVPRVSETDS